ncbi:SH3 domain-containing protein [Streptomyces sp. Z26]|uniref:SH3 domain-containing protein n=1 Tax=Streptomyces sp. Z26 TaxID=2500177 RepID=UPI000EF155A7|nr:SH3 domain-containing protein [Streptomyces sp. Z26]RLL66912.1 SH3 domain-containing protein [Streptomyces sp. Z26]
MSTQTARTRRTRYAAVTLALGVAAGGASLGLAAGSAQAAAPAKPYGTVDTISGKDLNVRQYPSTDSTIKGALKDKSQFGIDCKVDAQKVGTTATWYKMRGEEKWVTGNWSKATGTVKTCDDFFPAKKQQLSPNAVG